jgi:OOP family OmpA-OmpF porin
MRASKIVGAAALALAAFSGSVQAQGWMRSSQELGFYVGAGVGGAEVRNLCSEASAAGFTSCDEKDRTWKVSAGYRFHRNIAIEAGYVDLGKYSAGLGGTNVRFDAKAFELLAVGIVPVTQAFSVYGKAGLARWDVDAAISGTTFRISENGTDFTFGVGAQYDFTQNLAGRLEWQRYTDIDVNTLGVALLFMFR